MHVVVLAGGAGMGLRPVTGGKPKVLLKVCGESVIEIVLKNLIKAGARKVTLVSDRPEEFEDVTVRYGSMLEFEVRRQSSEGIVGALLEAKDEVSSGALLVYGDTLTDWKAYEITYVAGVDSGRPTLLVVPEEDVRLYGAVLVDASGLVSKFVEAPRKAIEGTYAFGGIAVLNKELVSLIERLGNIEEAINEYVGSGGEIKTALWGDWWVDIGYPVNLLEATYYIMRAWSSSRISSKAKVASTAVIEGPVVVEEGAVIDHYAVIKGPAYIGRDCLVGTHTFIRPFTDVEELSTIGSYSEIVWSLISREATIGRNVFLGYSVVGEGGIVEPGVMTKLLTKPEEAGIKAIKVVRRRREIYKIGCTVPARSRVRAGSILEPGVLMN